MGSRNKLKRQKKGAWSLRERERQGKGQVGGERCWHAPERAACGSFGVLAHVGFAEHLGQPSEDSSCLKLQERSELDGPRDVN